ncbi:TRAM domain-containing protein [Halopenitus sp. H-Gu1]|uniref:TRAM domain-containing protein n=1 Tax=Halopenitus sp. H-Gu1 TaxID=3242697 RepID=UPI00359CD4CA
MVDIPDTLRSVFTTTVESDDGGYILEIPANEVRYDAIQPGDTYRIAVLEAGHITARSDTQSADRSSETSVTAQETDHSEPPVEEGEIRDVTVEAVGDQGDGIAKVDRGYVVIVPEGQPGDEPTVEIEQVQQNVAFAKIVEPDPRTL